MEKLQSFLLKGQSLYETGLQHFIEKIVEVYKDYPYLLVALIALVPLVLFVFLWFFKKAVELLQRNKNYIDVSSPYFKGFFAFLLWYGTGTIYEEVNLSLNDQFEFYEKFIFSISMSITTSLVFVSILKVLSQNAFDQFNSVLKKDMETLKEDLNGLKHFVLFYISFYLLISNGLGWKSLAFWIGTFGVIHITRLTEKNKESLALVLEYLFGEVVDKFKKGFLGPVRIISFFIVLLMAFIYRIVFALSYFELTKKLAAKIIRQQVERVSGRDVKNCEIPDFYREAFEKLDLKSYRPSWLAEIQESIFGHLKEWEEDPINESFIHLVGDPGSGRNALVGELEESFSHLNPVRIDVPKKIYKKEDFLNFIGKAVRNVEAEEDDGMAKYKLVIFNNAENFYLNMPGGFDALKEMFRIVNRSENSFFWVNVFDYYPWMHIEDFFGHVHHRQKFILKGFSDSEIKQLVLNKNSELKTKIVYDKAIYEATSKKGSRNNVDNVSTHFFRMIWEQSGGNPTMAQELWLKSIKFFNENEKTIRVGLPERNKVSILRELNTDALFVYNALIKHTKLNFEECCLATSLSARVVRFSLIFGENEKFLVKDDENNFTIAREWYGTLANHLKTKNLIYG